MVDNILRLTGKVDIAAAAPTGKTPTITALVYSGGILNAPGYVNTVVDLAGVDASGEIPILIDHSTAVDSIAGQGTVANANGQLHLQGTLTDATTAGSKVLGLARSKMGLQASIGLAVERKESIAPGKTVLVNGRSFTAGPAGLNIVRQGRLREVSLVAVGGDPDTQVSISARCGSLSEGNESMTIENTPATPDPVAVLRC